MLPHLMITSSTETVLPSQTGAISSSDANRWFVDNRHLQSAIQEDNFTPIRLVDIKEPISCVARDGMFFALATANTRFIHVVCFTGQLLQSYGPLSDDVLSVGWAPGNNKEKNLCLVALTSSACHLWPISRSLAAAGAGATTSELSSTSIALPCPDDSKFTLLTASPRAAFIAAACERGHVHCWDTAAVLEKYSSSDGAATPPPLALTFGNYERPVRCITWDSQGRFLAAADGSDCTVWDMSGTGAVHEAESIMCCGHEPTTFITSLAFQPNGPLLATGSNVGTIALFDSNSFRCGGVSGPCAVAFLPTQDDTTTKTTTTAAVALWWSSEGKKLFAGSANEAGKSILTTFSDLEAVLLQSSIASSLSSAAVHTSTTVPTTGRTSEDGGVLSASKGGTLDPPPPEVVDYRSAPTSPIEGCQAAREDHPLPALPALHAEPAAEQKQHRASHQQQQHSRVASHVKGLHEREESQSLGQRSVSTAPRRGNLPSAVGGASLPARSGNSPYSTAFTPSQSPRRRSHRAPAPIPTSSGNFAAISPTAAPPGMLSKSLLHHIQQIRDAPPPPGRNIASMESHDQHLNGWGMGFPGGVVLPWMAAGADGVGNNAIVAGGGGGGLSPLSTTALPPGATATPTAGTPTATVPMMMPGSYMAAPQYLPQYHHHQMASMGMALQHVPTAAPVAYMTTTSALPSGHPHHHAQAAVGYEYQPYPVVSAAGSGSGGGLAGRQASTSSSRQHRTSPPQQQQHHQQQQQQFSGAGPEYSNPSYMAQMHQWAGTAPGYMAYQHGGGGSGGGVAGGVAGGVQQQPVMHAPPQQQYSFVAVPTVHVTSSPSAAMVPAVASPLSSSPARRHSAGGGGGDKQSRRSNDSGSGGSSRGASGYRHHYNNSPHGGAGPAQHTDLEATERNNNNNNNDKTITNATMKNKNGSQSARNGAGQSNAHNTVNARSGRGGSGGGSVVGGNTAAAAAEESDLVEAPNLRESHFTQAEDSFDGSESFAEDSTVAAASITTEPPTPKSPNGDDNGGRALSSTATSSLLSQSSKRSITKASTASSGQRGSSSSSSGTPTTGVAHRRLPPIATAKNNNTKQTVADHPLHSVTGEEPDSAVSIEASCTIYVGNLAASVDEYALAFLGNHFGPVLSVQVIRDKDTHASRGFGFVTFAHPAYASLAMQQMHGQVMFGPFGGQRIKVAPTNKKPTGPAFAIATAAAIV